MRPAALALLFPLLLGLPVAYSQTPVPGSITGFVLDPVGKPLKDAVVTIVVNQEIRALETEIDGVFRFDRMAEGSYLVSVERAGYLRSEKRIILGRNAADPLEFHLLREAIIAGHIKNENGEPLTECGVMVMQWDYRVDKRGLIPAGDTKAVQHWTGPDGSFAIGGLAPGRYYLVAVPPNIGYAPVMVPTRYQVTYYPGTTALSDAVALQVFAGQRISAEIVLHFEPAFRVTAKLQNLPADVIVWARIPVPLLQEWKSIMAITTRDGRKMMTPLPRGEVLIEATTGSIVVVASERLFLDRDREITLTRQPAPPAPAKATPRDPKSDVIPSAQSAEIQGVVRDPDGRPVAGARVAMWRPGPTPPDPYPTVTVTNTEADGTYRMKTGFRSGDYVVLASEAPIPSPYSHPAGPFLFPPFRSQIEGRATPVRIGEVGTTAILDPAYVTAAEVFAAEAKVR